MRRLAISAFAFSAAVFLSHYLLPVSALPWLALGFAAIGAGLLLARRVWLRLFTLLLLGLSLGFGCFYVHARQTLLPARALDGETRVICGVVTDYPECRGDSLRLQLRLEGEGLPRLNALVYDGTRSLSTAQPGDLVRFEARLSSAETRHGARSDLYNSKDIYFILSAKSQAEYLGRRMELRLFPAVARRAVAKCADGAFPQDVRAFMRALLLGDKDALYADAGLYRAMSRAGFLHITAVSGMHVAFLVGLLQLLLGASRRNSLLCIALVWAFVFLTGASPSAVRAGIMQSFLLLAPLFGRENDAATSLGAALGLILLLNPSAAGSISLQLSFAAMAGILCFAAPLQRALEEATGSERLRRLLRAPIATAASSLAVLAFTVPLSAIHFGSVQVLSPLTNLLGLWAVSLCFCGGFLSVGLFALLPAAGSGLGWLTAWLARYLVAVARLVSAVPFASVYLQHGATVIWLVLCYVFVLTAVFFRLPLRVRLLAPLILCALTLAMTLAVTRWNYRSADGVISAIDVGQGQCISVMAGDQTVVVDCGSILTLENAGETAGEYLLACGRRQVDLLMLTHLHADHCNGVETLMTLLPVKRLVLANGLEDEDDTLAGILSAAEASGTEVEFLTRDAQKQLGEIRMQFYYPGPEGDANERCLAARISVGDYDLLVTGDLSKSAERALVQRCDLSGTEAYIVGHHGSKYASSGELLAKMGGDTALISVGWNNFGHPTDATLQRLDAYGYTIYRTDQSGTIEIWIG